MSAELQSRCAQSVSDETLSALRDDLLPPDEAERLRVHAAACVACRHRLDGFARVGAALRGQRLAGPSARLWDDVQAAITAGEHSQPRLASVWLPSAKSSRPAWRGLGALAAALLIALLFSLVLRSALVGHGGNITHIQPTATGPATWGPLETITPVPTVQVEPPIAGTPPDWHEYTLPAGFQLFFPVAVLSVAPSDGDTAYMCQGGEPATMLVTHDRGADWARVSDVASGTTCSSLTVDHTNPNILVSGSFLSVDGGASWQPLPTSSQIDTIAALAWSGRGAAYAMIGTQDAAGETLHIAMSEDGLNTWHTIDGGIAIGAGTGDELRRFWANPTNGHLLVATLSAFWQSNDGGQTWTRITLPGTDADGYVVQQPSGSGDWHICSPFDCTADGGRTWMSLPKFLPVTADGGGGAEFALAIASDGSLLVYGSGPTPGAFTIYKLPAGGSRWRDIGAIPAPPSAPGYGVLYEPELGTNGVLWSLPPGGKGAFSTYYSAALPAVN